MTTWQDIAPADAVSIDCRTRPDLNPPRNENGEVCPWPWEPQQLVGVPMGQYHCGYCGAGVMAGVPHLDWRGLDDQLRAEHEQHCAEVHDGGECRCTVEPPPFGDEAAAEGSPS